MKMLFVSVGREEYRFQRKVAEFLKKDGWDSLFVTLGRYNVDYNRAPGDTTVVEESIEGLFEAPRKKSADLEVRIRRLEEEFGVPCIRRLYFTDRLHRPRMRAEWQFGEVLCRYFNFWKEYLRGRDFDMGFMGHGGEMLRWGAFHNCKKLGIRLYQNFFSPLPGRVSLLTNMDHELEGVDWVKEEEISAELRAELEEFVENLREGRKDFVRIRKIDFHWSMPLLLVRAMYRKFFSHLPQYRTSLLWEYTRESFLRIIRKHLMKVLYEEPILEEKFIFFPLHHVDDAQITVRAPHYLNQFSLLEILANALPYGHNLYIKEHPSLIGGFKFGEVRRLLRKCRNVKIINPLYHPHKLIRGARAVATINSTTGFEAIVFKKPLLVFGQTYYRDAGLSVNVRDLESLTGKVSEVLRWEPVEDERILKFLAKLYSSSFPGEAMSIDYSEENAASISRALLIKSKR